MALTADFPSNAMRNNGKSSAENVSTKVSPQGRETRLSCSLTHESVANLGKLFYLDGEPFHYRARHDGV